MAYEIAKKQYGYYVYIRFQCEGTLIKELEREYKLDESIIRYLTVLIPKIVLKNESESEKSSPKKTQENEDTETKEDFKDKTPES